MLNGQPTTQAHASCLSTSALSSPQSGSTAELRRLRPSLGAAVRCSVARGTAKVRVASVTATPTCLVPTSRPNSAQPREFLQGWSMGGRGRIRLTPWFQGDGEGEGRGEDAHRNSLTCARSQPVAPPLSATRGCSGPSPARHALQATRRAHVHHLRCLAHRKHVQHGRTLFCTGSTLTSSKAPAAAWWAPRAPPGYASNAHAHQRSTLSAPRYLARRSADTTCSLLPW